MIDIQPTLVKKDTTTNTEVDKALSEIESVVITDEYLLWVLNYYYYTVAPELTLEWEWDTVVIGGIPCKYADLDDRYTTIWGGIEGVHPYTIAKHLVDAIDKLLESSGWVLPKFRWRPHQIGEGYRIYTLLAEHGWGYLQHLPRTGKTGTALFALDWLSKVEGRVVNILISTTKNGVKGNTKLISKVNGKKPLEGWMGFIKSMQDSGYGLSLAITMTTPHQTHKLMRKAIEWDCVVVDEAHKIYSSPSPKPSELWTHLHQTIRSAKCIFVSATPHAQSINQLYWQLALCIHTPFMVDGLDWKRYFALYGTRKQVIIGGGRAIEVYTEGKATEVKNRVSFGFSTLSQLDVGFVEELLPIDVPVRITLTGKTALLMQEYAKSEHVEINGTMVHTMNSGDVPLRLHQLEGGTLKYVDTFSCTDMDTGIRIRGMKPTTHNWLITSEATIDHPEKGTIVVSDKVKYIWDKWGDREDIVIFYHYVNEGKMLRQIFKKAKILQGTTNAEAIDLWMYEACIVYTMNWSVSTYVQRRDRQVHLTKRTTPISIYYLIGETIGEKGKPISIGNDIYESVVERGEDLTMKYYR